MSDILIEANNISKIYDQDFLLKRGGNFYALQKVDFVLKAGDFISVMGPSGSGKSTLLNCLSTIDKISGGLLKVLGNDVSQMNDKKLSSYRNQYLGFIFQNHNLLPSLTIFDNIATPLILNEVPPQQIINDVNDIAIKLKIEKILYKKPSECSGGERQRAAIARAIVNKPKILFCDEPTGNLDTSNSHELLGMLKELNDSGTTIILVTHDSMIASYAKKLVYLRDSRIINEIERNNANQVDFYNEIVKITTQDSLLKLFNVNKEIENANQLNKVEIKTGNQISNKQIVKKDTSRYIVYAVFNGYEYDQSSIDRNRVLYFNKDTINCDLSNVDKLAISYHQIDHVNLSMCARLATYIGLMENRFHIDLDIVLKDDFVYKFEINNQQNATILFDVLEKHQIKTVDHIGVEKLYRQKSDYLIRHRYLLYNFKKIAKEYNLDNPRGH